MKNRRESKKIFILASTLVVGGAEMIIRSLAENLSSGGFDVELLFLKSPGKVGRDLIEKGFSYREGMAKSRFGLFAIFRLAGVLREERNSVLLSLDHHNALFLGGIASRLAGIRGSVLSVHSTGLWGSGRTFNPADRVFLRLFDRIVALSEMHSEYLVSKEAVPSGRVAIINNGIDISRFIPGGGRGTGSRIRDEIGAAENETVVTIVAALRPEKNHEMFLDGAGKVLERSKNVKFLVVGDGECREELMAEAKRKGIGEYLLFLGSRDDIPDILEATDIAVLTSYPVVETFPLTVLEAMACGLPVISTDVGSVSEIVLDGETGILIASEDSSALAESILRLEAEPELRKRMGEAGRERAEENYSTEVMVDRYTELLDQFFQ